MPVNLSIKNVPDEVAAKLRQRAKINHRSLQGELLALLQDSVEPASKLNARELLQLVRDTGLGTPREATATLRAIRDAG